MKKIITIIAAALALSGCSVYQAAHAPDPVPYKDIRVGMSRSETIALLGMPKMTDSISNGKVDHYEFFDGYDSASKARIIPYIAGDLFTIGLAELIFWPIEANIFDGDLCRASITLDKDDRISSYDVFADDGVKVWSSPAMIKPAVVSNVQTIQPQLIVQENPIQQNKSTEEKKNKIVETEESIAEKLKSLKDLKDKGILTKKEYEVRRKALVESL